jgi:hypothetical protein
VTLLSVTQAVCRQLGLPQPNAAFSATDDMVEQIVILAQEAGDDLMRDHDWSVLTVVKDFTGSGVQVQGDPPTVSIAFDRFAQNTGIWDTGQRRMLSGPKTPAEWQGLTIDNLGNPHGYWTMLGGVINILPAPAITDTFRYTYITKNWIRVALGSQISDIAEWNNDTNTSLLPERLIKLSTIWRWKQVKGLSYEEDMATFEREKIRHIARDRGPRSISTSAWIRDEDGLLDTWWPGGPIG